MNLNAANEIDVGNFAPTLGILKPYQLPILVKGNVSIAACPGSGKTFSVVYRFLCRSENELRGKALITFTDAAAEEALSRCVKFPQLTDPPNYVGTLDSLLLHSVLTPFHRESRGIAPLVTATWQEIREAETNITLRSGESGISLDRFQFSLHNDSIVVEKLLPKGSQEWSTFHRISNAGDLSTLMNLATRKVFSLWKRGLFTFDSMKLFIALNSSRGQVSDRLSLLASRFYELIIDEGQDFSKTDWIVLYSIHNRGVPWVIVGDPDQSIYDFRQADLATFVQYHEQCDHKYEFSINSRSTQTICDFGDAIRDPLRTGDKAMRGTRSGPDTIYVIDPTHTSPIDRFEALVSEHQFEREESCVLARTWERAAALAGDSQFRKDTISTNERGTLLVHHGSIALNQSLPVRRRMDARRKLGDVILSMFIDSNLALKGSRAERIEMVSGNPEQFDDLVSRTLSLIRTATSSKEFAATWKLYFSEMFPNALERRSLGSRIREPAPSMWERRLQSNEIGKSTVEYSTIHSSKGKEWPCVMLSTWQGFDRDDDPIQVWTSGQSSADTRLLYVGAARAQCLLCIYPLPNQIEPLLAGLNARGVAYREVD